MRPGTQAHKEAAAKRSNNAPRSVLVTNLFMWIPPGGEHCTACANRKRPLLRRLRAALSARGEIKALRVEPQVTCGAVHLNLPALDLSTPLMYVKGVGP